MARTKVAEPNGNGHQVAETMQPPVQSINRATVSQQSLDMLIKGKEDLIRKRQELDMLIQRQEGGILLMQALIESQGDTEE